MENRENLKIEYDSFDLVVGDFTSEIRDAMPEKDENSGKMVKFLFEKPNFKHIILAQLCAWNKNQLAMNCFEQLVAEPVDLSLDFNDQNFALIFFHIFHISGGKFDLATQVTRNLIEAYVRGVHQVPYGYGLNEDQSHYLKSNIDCLERNVKRVLQEEGHFVESLN